MLLQLFSTNQRLYFRLVIYLPTLLIPWCILTRKPDLMKEWFSIFFRGVGHTLNGVKYSYR